MKFFSTTITYHLTILRTTETDNAVNFSTLPVCDLTPLINCLAELPAKVDRLRRQVTTAWKVASIGFNSLTFAVC